MIHSIVKLELLSIYVRQIPSYFISFELVVFEFLIFLLLFDKISRFCILFKFCLRKSIIECVDPEICLSFYFIISFLIFPSHCLPIHQNLRCIAFIHIFLIFFTKQSHYILRALQPIIIKSLQRFIIQQPIHWRHLLDIERISIIVWEIRKNKQFWVHLSLCYLSLSQKCKDRRFININHSIIDYQSITYVKL